MTRTTPESRRKIANLLRDQTLSTITLMKPDWLRIPAASRVSGLSRDQLFKEIKTGRLRSKLYVQTGNTKGVRLIHYASLLSLIESLPE